ncbi:MAG: hypothetical protein JW833_03385 [Prolixibacteraceae bacterium]|nr:hypothetical protein [Prolixibacteraceae bacterium]
MKTTENYLAELKEIRKMMEESSRFLSLSGLSGILIGIYALIGAYLAYRIIYIPSPNIFNFIYDVTKIPELVTIGAAILLLSFITVIWLTYQRAKKAGKRIWNTGSRLLLLNLMIPLVSGGILILVFLFRELYEYIFPVSLIFYGLALINAAKFTRQEIFFMGVIQLLLGLFSSVFPEIGILSWAVGFGVIHIVYGTVMYFRYEHITKQRV